MKKLKNFIKNIKGLMIVEFAIVAPILLGLIFGFFNYGTMFIIRYSIDYGMQIANSDPTIYTMSTADATQKIRDIIHEKSMGIVNPQFLYITQQPITVTAPNGNTQTVYIYQASYLSPGYKAASDNPALESKYTPRINTYGTDFDTAPWSLTPPPENYSDDMEDQGTGSSSISFLQALKDSVASLLNFFSDTDEDDSDGNQNDDDNNNNNDNSNNPPDTPEFINVTGSKYIINPAVFEVVNDANGHKQYWPTGFLEVTCRIEGIEDRRHLFASMHIENNNNLAEIWPYTKGRDAAVYELYFAPLEADPNATPIQGSPTVTEEQKALMKKAYLGEKQCFEDVKNKLELDVSYFDISDPLNNSYNSLINVDSNKQLINDNTRIVLLQMANRFQYNVVLVNMAVKLISFYSYINNPPSGTTNMRGFCFNKTTLTSSVVPVSALTYIDEINPVDSKMSADTNQLVSFILTKPSICIDDAFVGSEALQIAKFYNLMSGGTFPYPIR